MNRIIHRLIFCFLISINIITLSCSKSDVINEVPKDENIFLNIMVEQIDDFAEFKSASINKDNDLNGSFDTYYMKLNDLDAKVSIEVSKIDKYNSSNVLKSGISASKLAAGNTMTPGNLYRFILYDKSSNPSTFVSSTLGKAGTALRIPVQAGKNYDWVVVSYNSTEDPGSAIVNNSTIVSSQKDLLQANGITGVIPTGANVSVPIKITLRHKLARVNFVVDASQLSNGSITSIGAQWGAANYFANASLNIKDGVTTRIANSINNSSMSFSPAGNSPIKTVTQYTSKNTSSQILSTLINSLTVSTSEGVKTLSSAQTFNWPTIQFQEGYNYTLKVEYLPSIDLSKYKIYSVGAPPYTFTTNTAVFASTHSGLYQLLMSPTNFGSNGVVKTSGNWSPYHAYPNDYMRDELATLNTGGYKMLIVGYDYRPPLIAVERIKQFVNNGGYVIYMGENLEDVGDVDGNEKKVVEYFAGGSQHSTAPVYWSNARLTNDGTLNGSFGDARGKIIGNDAHAGYALMNADLSKIDVLAYVSQWYTGVTTPTNGVAAFRAKGTNFYWFADGGFTVYYPWTTNGGGAGNTSYPFLLENSTKKPYIGAWNAGTFANSETANSVVIANIFERMLKGL